MLWLVLLLALVLVPLVPVIHWYYILFKFRSLNKIPGPKPTPIIGNYFPESGYELLKQFMARFEKYGSTFRLFTGSQVRIFSSNPAMLEYILSSNVHISKSDNYDYVKPWLGDGLLVSSGAKWKSRRRLITPTFHFKILEEFMTVFNSAGRVLVRQMSKKLQDKSVDIYQLITLFSLDIICETSMGTKINAQENQNIPYSKAVRGFLDLLRRRFFLFWERSDLTYIFTPQYWEQRRHIKVLHDFTSKIIKERQAEYKANGGKSNNGKCASLIDMLLQSQSVTLNNEDIREEIDTLMFEGHDTVTSGISFTLYELSKDQKIQQKLYEEIISVIGTEDKDITMSELQQMKYLDMVMKEGQRITPSVPLIERNIKNECTIDGIKYPVGTVFSVFTYGLTSSRPFHLS